MDDVEQFRSTGQKYAIYRFSLRPPPYAAIPFRYDTALPGQSRLLPHPSDSFTRCFRNELLTILLSPSCVCVWGGGWASYFPATPVMRYCAPKRESRISTPPPTHPPPQIITTYRLWRHPKGISNDRLQLPKHEKPINKQLYYDIRIRPILKAGNIRHIRRKNRYVTHLTRHLPYIRRNLLYGVRATTDTS